MFISQSHSLYSYPSVTSGLALFSAQLSSGWDTQPQERLSKCTPSRLCQGLHKDDVVFAGKEFSKKLPKA
jgi:hypothetical protein